jgi:hypothetical protein
MEGCFRSTIMSDTSTLRLDSLWNSFCARKSWQGKMDHPRDCIAENAMLEPGPGG